MSDASLCKLSKFCDFFWKPFLWSVTALSSMRQAGSRAHSRCISSVAPRGTVFRRHFERVRFKLTPTPYAIANASSCKEVTIRWTAKFTHAQAGSPRRCHNSLLRLSAGKCLNWGNTACRLPWATPLYRCYAQYSGTYVFYIFQNPIIQNIIQLVEHSSHDRWLDLYKAPVFMSLDQVIR